MDTITTIAIIADVAFNLWIGFQVYRTFHGAALRDSRHFRSC